MKRRLFLHAGSAAAVSTLAACGGGGGDTADQLSAPAPTVGAAQEPDVLRGQDPSPTPTPNPTEAQDVTSAPTASALPEKILGCYYTTWDTGTYKITDVPDAFNLIFLFHSKPNGAAVNGSFNNVGNGSFMFEHYSAVSAEQIQVCRRRGQRVILTVGGAHAGYAWDTRTKSHNFVESFKTMYARLGGVDGIDFNNYEATILNQSNIGAVSTEMIWIASQLKGMYGSSFAVTSPPQPNSPEQQALMAAMAKAGVLDCAGPQFYDWSGFNAPGYIEGRMDNWVELLGGPSRALVGLSANYSNGPSMADCIREWNAVKRKYPSVRGAFCWSAQTMLAGGGGWGRTLKSML
ncbi:hypothetical protein WG922_02775 [Ramlibacter sp. AN1015]|uniref:hypothetical protein n=1 Tax=Ramlibacter sp. AN1015 TaxID=3133428 RepID=UPI0030C3D460